MDPHVYLHESAFTMYKEFAKRLTHFPPLYLITHLNLFHYKQPEHDEIPAYNYSMVTDSIRCCHDINAMVMFSPLVFTLRIRPFNFLTWSH